MGAAMLLLVVAVAGGVVLLGRDPRSPAGAGAPRTEASGSPSAGPSATPTEPPRMKVARAATLEAAPTCDTGTGAITPATIAIPGVTRGSGIVTPPRDANDIPGTPPLSTAGKYLFAWDTAQGTRPGDAAGNVLLNAHTWPDGSALGNALLAHLDVGGSVVVLGEGRRLCYRVTERVEVLASDGLPRYYDLDGPPQLAILACSGRRLGPGNWEKRTVWFASPVPA
ncbi:class F sortase [Nocardioides iriomotensis]|uniref:Class F sortase n=1 Tax=Nocardioides iriomotensis TaxID=715784 RepID=A0A4Q5IY61_9ACTN|nr:class F sortase [Nocardioides iriomotensis]RYU09961.1 class F sortase [Nocardioides iriomotensis]